MKNISKAILMKLTDVIQAGLKENKATDRIHIQNLNKKEVAALLYLGGYVVSN